MKAVVLAGGQGTRLRPLTYVLPKPLIPIGGKPMLEHIVESLASHGITEIIFTISYKGEMIRDYFRDGSKWGVSIDYCGESEPLGTAGCLLPLKEKLSGGAFLVVAGDNMTQLNFDDFLSYHKEKGGYATVALTQHPVPCEFGIADIEDNGCVFRFQEKPTFRFHAATCIMCLEPAIFDYIPSGFSNIPESVFPKLLAEKKLFGYPFQEFWADIGRLEDYLQVYQNGIPPAPSQGQATRGKVVASS